MKNGYFPQYYLSDFTQTSTWEWVLINNFFGEKKFGISFGSANFFAKSWFFWQSLSRWPDAKKLPFFLQNMKVHLKKIRWKPKNWHTLSSHVTQIWQRRSKLAECAKMANFDRRDLRFWLCGYFWILLPLLAPLHVVRAIFVAEIGIFGQIIAKNAKMASFGPRDLRFWLWTYFWIFLPLLVPLYTIWAIFLSFLAK